MGQSDVAPLMALAAQLRDAATEAGRLDVAGKADEAIKLLEPTKSDTIGTVLKTLDGLGL